LIERGFDCLQESVAMATAAESSSTTNGCSSASDLHLSLYKYCDRILRLADSTGGISVVVIWFCSIIIPFY